MDLQRRVPSSGGCRDMVEQFFTIERVAEMFSVHENTVRKMLKDGELQGIKIGREWRITGSAIDTFAQNAVCDYKEEAATRPAGKYAPLTMYLRDSGEKTISLSFSEIEKILDFPLPRSAREYDPWWHEEQNPRGQKLAWSNAGYSVDKYDIKAEKVTFRIKWNEETFTKEAELTGGPETVRKLKLFLDWGEAHDLIVLRWGKGKELGTVSFKFYINSKEKTLFCLDTEGKLETHIQPMQKIAPFNDKKVMGELIEKLRSFDENAFAGNSLKYPKTNLARNLDDTELEYLLGVFEWVLDSVDI